MTRLLIVLIAAAFAAQRPAAGSVAGRVVDAATGAPIAAVRVSLSQADAGNSATTDADGRYEFRNLGSGSYRLRVVAPGYVAREFGDAPPLAYTPVAPLGRDLTGIDIPLHRGATIAGRVADDLGQPVAAVAVRAFKLSGEPGNQLISRAGGRMGVSIPSDPQVQTDARGEFRLTAIAPGAYAVGAIDRTVVTFAPNTRSLAAATALTVSGNDERSGVEIKASRLPSGTIRGVVTGPGPAGSPISLVDVDLFPDPNEASLSPLRAPRAPGRYGIGADGRFELDNVLVGRYTIVVRPGGDVNAPNVWGRESVVVAAGAPVTPTVTLQGTGRVAGKLLSTPLIRLLSRVELHVAWDRGPLPTRASLAPDGSFVFTGLAPGRYRWPQAQTLGSRVLSAVIGGQDVTDIPLVITPTTSIENVQLNISESATITGNVLDATGAPTTAGAVIIASADRRDWTEISRRVRVVRADTNGSFEARALPAGRYRVTYVNRLPHERPWDATFLSTLAGQDVDVSAGQIARVDLRSRPAPDRDKR